jgi:hypothetical protein
MIRSSQLAKQDESPQLLNTREAAQLLARSPATLKRWRYQGIGPEFIAIEGRISYRLSTLLHFLDQHTKKLSPGMSDETS